MLLPIPVPQHPMYRPGFFVYKLKDSHGSETQPLDDPAHSHHSRCIPLSFEAVLRVHTTVLGIHTTANAPCWACKRSSTLRKIVQGVELPGNPPLLRPYPKSAPKDATFLRTQPQNACHHAAYTTYSCLLLTRRVHTRITLALSRPRIC